MNEKKTRKTVRIFAAASFLNDLGSDMIYPVWPLFVTSVLGANMAVLGFLDGLGEALVSISQAVSGFVSDKIRRRKVFVWTGYLFGAASRVGYALSSVWQHLIPFRILDRAGKMRGAPRDAMIADLSTRWNRGRNFGFLRMMDNLGAVCGIVIAILFFKILGYRTLFAMAAIPSIVGAILIGRFVKEKKLARVMLFKGLSLRDWDFNFWLFLVLSAVFSLGAFSYSFLMIYAKEFGFGLGFVPALYLVFTAVASVVNLPFGRLADKIGRKRVLMLSFVLWVLVCLSFIWGRVLWIIFLGFVFYGFHRGAAEPVQKAFVSELAPANLRASSLGGYQMVVGLCALPASLIAGLLWDRVGLYVPLYFSLGLTVVSILMLFFVKEK
jgi:MFS family permease